MGIICGLGCKSLFPFCESDGRLFVDYWLQSLPTHFLGQEIAIFYMVNLNEHYTLH